MNNREMVVACLEKMGYCPKIDNDGYVIFTYQMKTLCVIIEDDEHYISVVLPHIYEIKEGQDTLALAICNKITRDLKMIKVYIDQTFKNVTATCESFYIDSESLEQNLEYSLQLLGVVSSIFMKEMCCLTD